MAFAINDFRNQLALDGARPNLFEVVVSFPQITGGEGNLAASKFRFMCTAAQIPGSTIGQVNGLYYFGREVKIAGNRTYQDWTVNIINDEDFQVRKGLELWHYQLNGPTNNLRQPGALTVDQGYGVNAAVYQYGKAGNIIKEYTFVGMWPVDISAIDLAWGNNDSVEEFQTTFAYQYWTTNDPAEVNPT